jgi:Prp8 binding protein
LRVQGWDRRMNRIALTLEGHNDAVTGIELSPDGSYLLSNSMDGTVRQWDTRPFVSASAPSRCVATFEGVRHDVQKNLLRCAWAPDGRRISAGSADRLVNIWDVSERR